VIADPTLLGMETVYCGGARNDRTLEIQLSDLLRVSGALVQPIVRDEKED
jgi:prolyl-tRNA editing enzyme YbaK/EbsC (Cys-tRNA(Pro) deacylase)